MELNIKLIAFYSHKEIIIKDVEKDLYTKDRKIFHLFLFNNKPTGFIPSEDDGSLGSESCPLELSFRRTRPLAPRVYAQTQVGLALLP